MLLLCAGSATAILLVRVPLVLLPLSCLLWLPITSKAEWTDSITKWLVPVGKGNRGHGRACCRGVSELPKLKSDKCPWTRRKRLQRATND
jgi:hypothetical protein